MGELKGVDNDTVFLQKINPEFSLYYFPYIPNSPTSGKPPTRQYMLSEVIYCCVRLVFELDTENLYIAARVDVMNNFRVRLNHDYIRCCPFCKAEIVCYYRQAVGVNTFDIQHL